MTVLAEIPASREPLVATEWWRPWLLPSVVVVGAWAQFVWKMWVDWSTNGQYEFGIFVPVLIAFLLKERWMDRPPAERSSATVIAAGLLCAMAFLLPIRLIQEANPEWRPLNWAHATILVGATLVPIYAAGGRSWLRHFAPPLMLLFMALPWTLALEQSVIQFLARGVSAVTAELLNWSGIPALRTGNVIEVPTGPVGVQDACTGIRSLAGSLMSAVFFGEYYRFSLGRRLLMVTGGLLIALVLNLVRTFFLCWIAATRGVAAVSGWHDHAGLLIFFVSFAALWFLAGFLNDPDEEDEDVEQGDCQPDRGARIIGNDDSRLPAQRIGAAVAICAAVLLVGSEIMTAFWYAAHERGREKAISWEPAWPKDEPGFKFNAVSDEARAILRYSEGYAANVPFLDGREWGVFFFRWAPGRSSSQLAVLHRPEICLPAAGFRMVGPAAPLEVAVDGLVLPFQATVFDANGRRCYVYRTLWEQRPAQGDLLSQGFDQSLRGRLASVWHGRRNLGQQLLQISIAGAPSEDAARADLTRRLPGLIAVSK